MIAHKYSNIRRNIDLWLQQSAAIVLNVLPNEAVNDKVIEHIPQTPSYDVATPYLHRHTFTSTTIH